MAENRFLELYERGRISDLRTLSRAWHELVKRTHPDATGSDESSHLFSQIQAEYHEARTIISAHEHELPESTSEATAISRFDFYQEFNDILRRGFPLDPTNTRLPSTYFKSREIMTHWFDAMLYPNCFAGFEKDLLDLKKNSTYFSNGPLMPVFYQICDFHFNGTQSSIDFCNKEWPRMERLLARRGKADLSKVVGWLLNDLEQGAALLAIKNR